MVLDFLANQSDFGFVHQVLTFTRIREGSRITASRRANSLGASKLTQLVTHGPDFLSPEEFARCLDESVSEYYWNLAGSFVRGPDRAYWDYHERTLRSAGVGFSRARLAKTVIARIGAAGLNLEQSIRELLRVRGDRD